MYLEVYVASKLSEFRETPANRAEPCSHAGLAGAEIPRKNIGIRHEVFRRIIGQ
ncbi:MAG TPA: hypothetical protein VFY79_02775 [Dehalococcoidia bacterium]|jgi:hypothetical protein|nr:hypothetical protein [Dehalococcoidia bacterium]